MTTKMAPAVFPTSLRSQVEKAHDLGGCSSVNVSVVTLSLSSTGDYEISVKFNDQHIPDSPYLVPVAAPANDARCLTVTGLQVRHKGTPPQRFNPAFQRALGAQLHKRFHTCLG